MKQVQSSSKSDNVAHSSSSGLKVCRGDGPLSRTAGRSFSVLHPVSVNLVTFFVSMSTVTKKTTRSTSFFSLPYASADKKCAPAHIVFETSEMGTARDLPISDSSTSKRSSNTSIKIAHSQCARCVHKEEFRETCKCTACCCFLVTSCDNENFTGCWPGECGTFI